MTRAAERVRAIDWSPLEGLDLEAPIRRILENQPAERVLDRFLRDHRDFTAAQRKATAEALFGIGLWRRRLIKQGGKSVLHALTHLGPDPEGFADRHSLPDWLAAELQRTPDPEALADALNQPGPICLRARDDREALAADLEARGIHTRPGRYAPQCLVVTSDRPNLLGLGRTDFEVQDEGSQLLGELVQARPGDTVLDLCAGAGGKTLQLAAALRGQGAVHACDLDLERLERLRRRAERAGATGIAIHGRAPPPTLRVDAALVDAPCSELGALRRGPDLRWRLDPASFSALPALQLELLERAASHARRRLVYATCTFRREENEDVCEAFERSHPEFRRAGERFFHCWPHTEGTDAFFGAVYERHRESLA
ncbi:MAG: RsmB/NOP family class I SAM-dependent RNA methyltransferase [Archangiaceae bacterium]|nr:RsmB/NOP family class I SAM-dependent RNA methyltransferase [Archangiaceae bacterium]